jgi:hypothetical protein
VKTEESLVLFFFVIMIVFSFSNSNFNMSNEHLSIYNYHKFEEMIWLFGYGV